MLEFRPELVVFEKEIHSREWAWHGLPPVFGPPGNCCYTLIACRHSRGSAGVAIVYDLAENTKVILAQRPQALIVKALGEGYRE